MGEVEFSPVTCPGCDRQLCAGTALEEASAPEPGDVSICLHCRTVALFTEGGALRRMSDEEWAALTPTERRDLEAAIARVHGGSA